jgi:hypothetical protein
MILGYDQPPAPTETEAAPLNGFIDFIKDQMKGRRSGPGASASTGAERADEPVDEHADAR